MMPRAFLFVCLLAACNHASKGEPDAGIPDDLAEPRMNDASAKPSDGAATEDLATADGSIPTGTCGAVLAVAAGGVNTCYVRADHVLLCTGVNDYGQLGDGTQVGRTSFASVTSLGADVLDVGIGSDSHVCAVMTDHTVRCAGGNTYGQLGNGTTTSDFTFVTVSELADVVEVRAGHDHTCARKSDGTVWCWGDATYGKLGDGTTVAKTKPVQVMSLTTATQLVAGWDHTCVRKSDGTVWCWGRNGYGMLGDDTFQDQSKPVQAKNLTGVTSVSSGAYDVCAVTPSGDFCWGGGHDGQMNDGTMDDSGKPKQVTAIGTIGQSANGYSSTWAVKADHTVWYWGFGALTGVTQVTGALADSLIAGDDHQCLVRGGVLSCWGFNEGGELGDGTTDSRGDPTQVTSLCP